MYIFRLTYVNADKPSETALGTASEVFPFGNYSYRPYAIHFNKLVSSEDAKHIDLYKVPFLKDSQDEYKYTVDIAALKEEHSRNNWREFLSSKETNKGLTLYLKGMNNKETEHAYGLHWLSYELIPVFLRNLNDTIVSNLSKEVKELNALTVGTEAFTSKLKVYKGRYIKTYDFAMSIFLPYYAIATSKLYQDQGLSLVNEHDVPLLTSLMLCLDLHKNKLSKYMNIKLDTKVEEVLPLVEDMKNYIDNTIYTNIRQL